MFETYPKRLSDNKRNTDILQQKPRRFQKNKLKTDRFSLSKFLQKIKFRKWKVSEVEQTCRNW